MLVTEQNLTNVEVIERLQETVTMVDKLKEAVVLEKRLKEVKDLEERLQEVDEMAERLQEVIEVELGKEEVEKLKEEERELEQQQQIQAARIAENVLRKSVSTVETKEDEVDELEEQIKQVFLKGLLPEEEEVEVKQESEKEVTEESQSDDGLGERQGQIEKEWKVVVKQESEKEVTEESLSDDSMREKLRQMEKEWTDKVMEELKSGSSDVATTTSVVTYQKVERRTKKRVTIVEERGQKQEAVEDAQVQRSVMSEERLETVGTWRKTETLEEITEGEVTERRQAEDQSQVADEDIWYIVFDRPPYKAVFTPPGTVWHCANSFRLLLILLISLPFSSRILFVCCVH